MPFGKKDSPPAAPKTPDQLVDGYRRQAADHLDRAAKAGRLEAETRHATMGTCAAVLAVSYQLQMLLGQMTQVAAILQQEVTVRGERQ